MNMCEQAKAFRLLLLMGLISKSEVIAWADSVIMGEEHPPEWLLDLSLAANDSESAIESRLREIPFEGDRLIAAYWALDRFSEVFETSRIRPVTAAWMLQAW